MREKVLNAFCRNWEVGGLASERSNAGDGGEIWRIMMPVKWIIIDQRNALQQLVLPRPTYYIGLYVYDSETENGIRLNILSEHMGSILLPEWFVRALSGKVRAKTDKKEDKI